MARQAVITGLGIVSPIGTGVDKFWDAARAGRSGIGHPTLFDASNLPPECQIVGEVRDFNPLDWMSPQAARMAGRFSQFAVASSKMAISDSGLNVSSVSPERILISIGTSMSGLVDVQQPNHSAFLRGDNVSPWTVLEYPSHAATSHVAIAVGARGETTSIATACVAGIDTIAWAAEKVRRGEASVVIAGATETPLSPPTLEGFRALGALSQWRGLPDQASRPFEKLRSGLVLAEGAAAVIIEDEQSASARGARIYARIMGTASVTEAGHLRNVDPSGKTTARAISLALERSAISPQEVDYLCAHGNSLIDYDVSETAGIKLALGRQAWSVPVSSIKSMCGQALAASGAMQIVTACLALRDEVVPPTINYDVPDPACDLDYVPNVARVGRLHTVLIHAQSIGGSHAVLVLTSPN
jgi:3-oxoacyl-[acyl-carrier-protein] synthase II